MFFRANGRPVVIQNSPLGHLVGVSIPRPQAVHCLRSARGAEWASGGAAPKPLITDAFRAALSHTREPWTPLVWGGLVLALSSPDPLRAVPLTLGLNRKMWGAGQDSLDNTPDWARRFMVNPRSIKIFMTWEGQWTKGYKKDIMGSAARSEWTTEAARRREDVRSVSSFQETNRSTGADHLGGPRSAVGLYSSPSLFTGPLLGAEDTGDLP